MSVRNVAIAPPERMKLTAGLLLLRTRVVPAVAIWRHCGVTGGVFVF